MPYGRTKDEALTELRKYIKPGDEVYTILRHVSSSGMMRAISLVIIRDGKPWDISYLAAPALGWTIHRDKGGIKVGGCGMDMGFHLVYSLSSALFSKGFNCISHKRGELVTPEQDWIEPYIGVGEPKNSKRCPANDHVNARRGQPASYRHRDGGYALNHRWL